jgi:Flp pilus assembly protein protease CpaA
MEWGVVICASLAAAITDVRRRCIPNVLTLPLLAGGMVFAYLQGGMQGAGESIAACIALAAPFVLLFVFGGGGAGDAKLMGAIGAWLGWEQGIVVLFCVCAAGMVLALAKAALKRRLRFVLANVFVSVYTFLVFVLSGRIRQYTETEDESENLQKSSRSDELTMPYGVAIFAGVCLAGGYVLLW